MRCPAAARKRLLDFCQRTIGIREKGGYCLKKFLRVLGNILVFVFLAVAVVVMASVLAAQKNRGIPQIFGYSMMNIKTDSMSPTLKPGDMIVIKRNVDFYTLQPDKDVITFETVYEDMPIIKTHRIVEKGTGKAGVTTYKTKGDNENDPDVDPVYADSIIGVWNNVRVPHLGAVMEFLKTQLGIMLCVILPLTILFIWQLYKFIMLIAENKKQKALAEVSVDIEAEKQKAVEEYIAQQKAQQEAEAIVSAKVGHVTLGDKPEEQAEEAENPPEAADAPAEEPAGNGETAETAETPAEEPADNQ